MRNWGIPKSLNTSIAFNLVAAMPRYVIKQNKQIRFLQERNKKINELKESVSELEHTLNALEKRQKSQILKSERLCQVARCDPPLLVLVL